MAAQLPAKSEKGGQFYRDPRVNFVLKEGEKLLPCPYDECHFVLPMKLPNHLTKCRHNYLNDVKRKKIAEGEEIVVCRFSYLHHVQKKLLAEHEDKCEKNPDTKLGLDMSNLALAESNPRKANEREKYNNYVKEERDLEEPPAAVKAYGFYGLRNKKDMTEQVVRNERLLTSAQEADPNENWELGLASKPFPGFDEESMKPKRFTMYNPQEFVSEHKTRLITNPQGLTKSERKEHRKRITENLVLEREEDELIMKEKDEEREKFRIEEEKKLYRVSSHVASTRRVVPQVCFPGYNPEIKKEAGFVKPKEDEEEDEEEEED